jgi:hypothetical protein
MNEQTETDVYVGLQRFVHNVAILLKIPPSRARDLLISILRRTS